MNRPATFVLTTTAKRCPCKVKGSLVLRHPAWPGDPTVEPASELTRPAEGERV